MKCHSCGGKLKTVDSRHADKYVRRVKVCSVCGDRMTTVEVSVGKPACGVGNDTQSRLYRAVSKLFSSV